MPLEAKLYLHALKVINAEPGRTATLETHLWPKPALLSSAGAAE